MTKKEIATNVLSRFVLEFLSLSEDWKRYKMKGYGEKLLNAFANKYGREIAEKRFILLNQYAFVTLFFEVDAKNRIYDYLTTSFDQKQFRFISNPWKSIADVIGSRITDEEMDNITNTELTLLKESEFIRLFLIEYLTSLYGWDLNTFKKNFHLIGCFLSKEDIEKEESIVVNGLYKEGENLNFIRTGSGEVGEKLKDLAKEINLKPWENK